MNDAAGLGALLGKGAHFSHQVMVDFGLNLQGALQVNATGVGFQFGHLGGCDQSELGLCASQGDPNLAPEQALRVFAP